MDVLRRAYSQLYDLFRSMTPGSRLMVAMLAVALLVGLGYLGTQQIARPDTDLMHGVSIAPSQLPLMEAAFYKAKLKYEIRGLSIFVPHGQESAYMEALRAANALPQTLGAAKREVMNNASILDMGTGRDQQRMKNATLETLAQAIRLKPGIESASVEYDVDSRPGPFMDKVATAIAYVKPTGSTQLDEATVRAIRDMVVHTFAGLKPEDVAVADLNGSTWGGVIGGNEEDHYRSVKHGFEQELQTKILDVLGQIPNVTVNVEVSLRRERPSGATTAHRLIAPAAARQADRPDRANTSSPKSNVATVLDALLSGTSGEGQSSPPERASVAASESAEKDRPVLTPISARVLVRVPMSYFKSLWRQRNPVETGQAEKTPGQAAVDQIRIDESANIRQCVAALLPGAKDTASVADLVTVTTYQDIVATPPSAPALGLGWNVWNWAVQSWKTIAWIGFGLLCLVVLRSLVWTKPREADEPATATVSEPAVAATPKKTAKVAAPHWRRDAGVADRSLREELSDLVEEDPETAANILRNWIGQV